MKSEEGTKHGGGRPKKPVKKETVTGVRFSKVEYFLVKQKAVKAGLGITVYIRQMALTGQVISKMSEEDRQFVRQFVGVSNNLNQLTKKAHQEGLLAAVMLIEGLGENLKKAIPGVSVIFFYLVSQAFTLLIATFLFAIIFKILPAARIKWKDVWPGALATAILFMIGRFPISFYVSKSDFGSSYGAAGSLIVLLVWIYYSFLILYFGAEFTKTYASGFGSGIQPNKYALSTAGIDGTQKKVIKK